MRTYLPNIIKVLLFPLIIAISFNWSIYGADESDSFEGQRKRHKGSIKSGGIMAKVASDLETATAALVKGGRASINFEKLAIDLNQLKAFITYDDEIQINPIFSNFCLQLYGSITSSRGIRNYNNNRIRIGVALCSAIAYRQKALSSSKGPWDDLERDGLEIIKSSVNKEETLVALLEDLILGSEIMIEDHREFRFQAARSILEWAKKQKSDLLDPIDHTYYSVMLRVEQQRVTNILSGLPLETEVGELLEIVGPILRNPAAHGLDSTSFSYFEKLFNQISELLDSVAPLPQEKWPYKTQLAPSYTPEGQHRVVYLQQHRSCYHKGLLHLDCLNRLKAFEHGVLPRLARQSGLVVDFIKNNPLSDEDDDQAQDIVREHIACSADIDETIESLSISRYSRSVDFGEDCPTSKHTFTTILNQVFLVWNEINHILLSKEQPIRTFIVSQPPGHHAHDLPEGFCYLNKVVQGVNQILDSYDNAKIAVIDLDAHYSDGVVKAIGGQPRYKNVVLLNLFNGHLFPIFKGPSGSGEAAKEKYLPQNHSNVIDIDLPNDTTGDKYLLALNDSLVEIPSRLGGSNPDFLIIAAGFDTNKVERSCFTFGDGLNLVPEDHQANFAAIVSKFNKTPCLVLLEGGYCPETTAVSIEHAIRGLVGL